MPGELLAARYEQLLAAYPTTLEEDLALASAGGLKIEQEMAVAYRSGKKRILTAALQHVRGCAKM